MYYHVNTNLLRNQLKFDYIIPNVMILRRDYFLFVHNYDALILFG